MKRKAVVGLVVAGVVVAAIAAMASSSSSEEEDEGTVPRPSPEPDEPEDLPATGPVPEGRPLSEAATDIAKKGEELLDEVRDKIAVDDDDLPSPSAPTPMDDEPDDFIPDRPDLDAKSPGIMPPTEQFGGKERDIPSAEDLAAQAEEVVRKLPRAPDILPAPKVEPGEVVPAAPAPGVDPATEKLLRTLLAKERSLNWKAVEPVVSDYQRAKGLTVDGKFGPGSARYLANDTGLLPIVRYWPRASVRATALPAYQSALVDLANKAEEPRRSHLLAAAEREQGQGFGTPPKPITPTIAI